MKGKGKTTTTTAAAKLCGVSHSTIIKWFDSGLIQGYRLPGSGDRRILLDSLFEFMMKHGIPLPEKENQDKEQKTQYKILVVDDDERIHKMIKAALSPQKFQVHCASDGYTAGLLTEKIRPHIIILDISLPDIDGRKVAEAVRKNIENWEGIIYAISGLDLADEEIQDLKNHGIDYFERKPIEMEKLIKKINELLWDKFEV